MQCPRCHTELYDTDRFCPHCGQPRPRPASKCKKGVAAIAKAVGFVLLFLVVQSATSGIYSGFLAVQSVLASGGNLSEAELYESIINALYQNISLVSLISGLVTILFLTLFFAVRHKNMFAEIHLHRVKPSLILWAALAGAAFNIFISVTINFLPLPDAWFAGLEEQYSYLGEQNLLLEILTTAILTGFLEETIFRGLVDSRLRTGLPTWLSVILSAFIFGLCHGTPIAVGYAFVVGLVFSLLFLRHGSILPSVVCHMCFNLTSLFLVTDNPLLLLGLYLVSIGTLLFSFYMLFRWDNTAPDVPRIDELPADKN